MTHIPRVVVVTRSTPYEELLARHATRAQAEFFLRQRSQTIATAETIHHEVHAAVARLQAAIPLEWRRNKVMRQELDRFLFEPNDTVVVVGQDGLVANVAKYLDGQLVIGVNPTPRLFDGVLVKYSPYDASKLLTAVAAHEVPVEERTMVAAELDDGQSLCALNELFLGQRTHQSARYELTRDGDTVTHSSSGVIVTTGTGSTGWARSIHGERHSSLRLPKPTEPRLAFFVREAFPSVTTSTRLAEGLIDGTETLDLTSRMEDGVIFGDGIEADYLRFGWGMSVRVRVSKKQLRLVGKA